jgi:class 3 adenylate cyclase
VSQLPSGTVTFLFSDIEGSTRLLQQLGERWGDALGEHRALLRGAFEDAGGREVEVQGDAFFAVFARARDAVAAAAAAQRAVAAHTWPDDIELRVRMGIHTGEPSLGEEGYLGLDVVRAARICSAAHGGQILVSETARALVGGEEFRDVGIHRLRDIDGEHRLFQLVAPGLRGEFPPPRTAAAAGDAPVPPAALAGLEEEMTRRAGHMAERLDASIQELVAAELRGVVPGFDLGSPGGTPKPTERPVRRRRLFRRGR